MLVDGSDSQQEGTWLDSNGNVLQINWGQAEPNGGTSENCLVLYEPLAGYVADYPCAATAATTLCEIEF